MADPFVLLVNIHKSEMEEGEIVIPRGSTNQLTRFDYGVPISMPLTEALALQNRYPTLRVLTLEQFKSKFGSVGDASVNIRRSEGMGDLLLLTPVLRQMSEGCHYDVDVGCRRDLMWLFDGNPHVRRVRVWDLHDSKDRDNYDPSEYLLDDDINLYSEVYAADRAANHRTIVYANRFNLALPDDKLEPVFYLTDDMKAAGEAAMPTQGGVGIQVTTSHDHRDYPHIEALAMALAERGTRVVMLCHWRPFECPKHDNIVDMMGDQSKGRALPGIIERLDAMIAADSGLMHLALAQNVPTVCMFGIISPELRIAHYSAPKEILYKRELACHGCGNKSMHKCKWAGTEKDKECMDFSVEDVMAAVDRLPKRAKQSNAAEARRTTELPKTNFSPTQAPAVVGLTKAKSWMTFMFHDEPPELMERFINRVCSHDAIEHIVAVFGGDDPGTEIFQMVAGLEKVELLAWPYQRHYWNMQAVQRNLSFDPIPDDTPAFYMDPDEEFNEALADWLPYFPASGTGYGLVARATWDRRSEFEAGGTPTGTHNWPDYQPRFFGPWRRTYRFDGAAHHVCLSTPIAQRIDITRAILHFEEESGHREQREAMWGGAMTRKKELIG